MPKLLSAALVAAAVLAIPLASARADCDYDLKQVKVKLAREQDIDRRIAIRKLVTKAEAQRPTSESECRNYAVRALRMLREEPVQEKPKPPETKEARRGIAVPDTHIHQPSLWIPEPNRQIAQPEN